MILKSNANKLIIVAVLILVHDHSLMFVSLDFTIALHLEFALFSLDLVLAMFVLPGYSGILVRVLWKHKVSVHLTLLTPCFAICVLAHCVPFNSGIYRYV